MRQGFFNIIFLIAASNTIVQNNHYSTNCILTITVQFIKIKLAFDFLALIYFFFHNKLLFLNLEILKYTVI